VGRVVSRGRAARANPGLWDGSPSGNGERRAEALRLRACFPRSSIGKLRWTSEHNDSGDRMDIFAAIWKGKLDSVRQLVSTDRSVINLKADPDGSFPIHAAAAKGNPEIVDLLLKSGANPNSRNSDGNSPAHVGHIGGKAMETIERLIKAGADVNAANNRKETPLHCAVAKNQILAVELLKNRADPNAQDEQGLTPLHWACKVCKPLLVRELLKKGAKSTIEDRFGRTALHVSAFLSPFPRLGKTEVAILLKHGDPKDIAVALKLEGCSAVTSQLKGDKHQLRKFKPKSELLYAVVERASGQADIANEQDQEVIELLQLLLTSTVDANKPNSDGLLPLSCAIRMRNVPVTQVLLEHGAKLSTKDCLGETPKSQFLGLSSCSKAMKAAIKKYSGG